MRKKPEPSLNAATPEQEKRTISPALTAHVWRPGQFGNPGSLSIANGFAGKRPRWLIGLIYWNATGSANGSWRNAGRPAA